MYRLSELPRHKQEKYIELRKLLKSGKLPAALINPELIRQHNEVNPPVSQITDADQEVSIEALFIEYAADGVSTRKAFNDAVRATEALTDDTATVDVPLSRRDRHQAMMESMNDQS